MMVRVQLTQDRCTWVTKNAWARGPLFEVTHKDSNFKNKRKIISALPHYKIHSLFSTTFCSDASYLVITWLGKFQMSQKNNQWFYRSSLQIQNSISILAHQLPLTFAICHSADELSSIKSASNLNKSWQSIKMVKHN